jgi:cellulose synthase/poly-beta-1,6-N-acetylglucosamine synthase-like glycosyltransferase
MIFTDILQYILIIYLGLSSFYIFIFAFASIFTIRPKMPSFNAMRKYAVLIPGYKEDQVIIDVAADALNQDYPKELYDVIVIADSFKKETLVELSKLNVRIIEVSFELSTKSKALNAAMNELGDDYDVAVVLDADNIMQTDFISKVNRAFNLGFTAVQGHRVAKNTNTNFAVLDAISEEVNNRIFRKGHRVLGLSAALIGSGMAIDYKYFKNMMKSIKAIGGFDKEIELQILKETRIIGYLEDAFVYDEKVQKAEVFSNQRRRWLSAQIHYFSKDFLNSVKHLFKYRNFDYFDKAIQFVQPPRIMLLGLLGIINIFSILFNSNEWIMAWLYVLAAVILTFIFSIPGKFYNLKTLFAVVTLPKAFFLMFLSLLRVRGANKKFIHTEHTST